MEMLLRTALVAATLIAMEILAVRVVFSTPAAAHEAPPATIDIRHGPRASTSISVTVDPAMLLAAFEGTDHEAYAGIAEAELSQRLLTRADELVASIEVTANGARVPLRLVGATASGFDLEAALDEANSAQLTISEIVGPAIVRGIDPRSNDVLSTAFVMPGQMHSIAEVQPETALSILQTYIASGFDHILPKGIDHILFVIGLFLLSTSWRSLLMLVSLFTLAHTATLGLAAAGLVSVPAVIVEPLIALSIAYVAVETLFQRDSGLWRAAVVVVFGLLHGLGFASVLSEFGLPTEQFLIALAAFNIGVEIGQITVITGCFLAVGFFARFDWYRSAIVVPTSLILAAIGGFWFVERLYVGLV